MLTGCDLCRKQKFGKQKAEMNHGLLGYRLTGQQTTPQPGIDLQGKSTAAEIKRDNTHLRTGRTDLILLQ